MSDVIEVYDISTEAIEIITQGPQGPAGSNGQGVPTGGTTGQVLKKASNANYDTEWGTGGGGGSGTVTSVALAGTGLSISGSPITASGTITANVAYGTTAGTACQGNDSRLSDARTPLAHTHASSEITDLKTNGNAAGLWDSVNDEQLVSTGDGELIIRKTGQTYGGAISAGQLTSDRGYNLPDSSGTLALTTTVVDNAAGLWDSANAVTGLTVSDYTLTVSSGANTSNFAFPPTYNGSYMMPTASGTLALTQQATDYEVTDATKGVIMKSPNGSRWRLTIDNNGSLIRTAIALLFTAFFLCGASAQVQDLIYGTNGVLIAPANLIFTNRSTFSNAITLPSAATTNSGDIYRVTNTLRYRDSTNAERLLLNASDNLANISSIGAARTNLALGWAALTNTNAATFRTDIGLGTLATNNTVPSGAAASNSLLTADGAGGSVFVASKTVTVVKSADQSKTNDANLTITNNNDPELTQTVTAGSIYRIDVRLEITTGTNSGFNAGIFTGATNVFSSTSQTVGTAMRHNLNSTTFYVTTGVPAAQITFGGAGVTSVANNNAWTATGVFRCATNGTLTVRWAQNVASNSATTLHAGSSFSLTKLN